MAETSYPLLRLHTYETLEMPDHGLGNLKHRIDVGGAVLCISHPWMATDRGREIAAAGLFLDYREQFSALEAAIKSGDGRDEDLYFMVLEGEPIAETLIRMTGSRTLLLDMEYLRDGHIEALFWRK